MFTVVVSRGRESWTDIERYAVNLDGDLKPLTGIDAGQVHEER